MLNEKQLALLESFKNTSEKIFAKDGYQAQLLFVFNENCQILNLVVVKDENQNDVAKAVEQMASLYPVVLFVSEAWVSKISKENVLSGNYVRPANDPNKQEVVMFNLFANGKRYGIQAPIIKNMTTASKKSLGEWSDVLEACNKDSLDLDLTEQTEPIKQTKGFYHL